MVPKILSLKTQNNIPENKTLQVNDIMFLKTDKTMKISVKVVRDFYRHAHDASSNHPRACLLPSF